MADHAEHEPATPVLQIRLFGPMQVRVDGVPIPPLPRHKIQWLLALLILRHGRPVERVWLAETLWPESDPTHALFNLRQRLPSLRQALGSASHRLTSPTAKTLLLDLTDAEVDLLDFDAALAAGDSASVQRAVALYEGPLLEGCLEEWAFSERQRREQSCLNALERLAEEVLERGECGRAVGYLRHVIGIEPLRESAHRRLMQAYGQSGDYSSVVHVYRALRVVLLDELQSQPDAQTKSLYERLRQQARERVSQSVRPHEAPQSASADGTGAVSSVSLTNLPQRLSSFIGRSVEIAELTSLLLPRVPVHPGSRLVTLTGSGGCGKTRLAYEVAAQLLEDYAEGIWLVELATLTEGPQVCQAVASVLGLREEPGKALQQTLVQHLKSRRVLLLLDNCEHLLAACATLAATLLKQCPDLRVLATSRSALKVEGEVAWRVPSLPTPEPEVLKSEKDLWGLVMDYDACRLFTERARGHRSDLVLSRSSAVSVARICERLDGIPLAIELAAARVSVLSVIEIEARLAHRFRLLTGGSHNALPRHQTLRALIDWSWELLDAQEKWLLARLSVFAGGWTLTAAEAVCAIEDLTTEDTEEHRGEREGISSSFIPHPSSLSSSPSSLSFDVLDLLSRLVDKSLVIADVQGETTRYRLLETVRQYARDRLGECGEIWTIRGRHRDYFLTLAEEISPKLSGSEQVHWLRVLEEEHDNQRAALTFCLEDPEGGEQGLQLGSALWRFWSIRGHLSEGREQFTALLAHPGSQQHTKARARALNNTGVLAQMQGDYASAYTQFEASQAIFRELGDKQGIAWALHNLGLMAHHQGDYASARALYEESLTIGRELGDSYGVANSLLNLANVAYYQGDYVSARALYEESLTILRELGDKQGIAWALNNLGLVAKDQGDYTAAYSLYEEGLTTFRELGERHGIALCLENIASLALKQGIGEHAVRLWGAVAALHEGIGFLRPPNEQADYDKEVAAAREALGEKEFAAAWEEGCAMTLEQALDYALEDTPA